MALPSDPITKARARKFKVVMSLFIQDQISQELQDQNFNKCCLELEGMPKPITLLKACIDEGAT